MDDHHGELEHTFYEAQLLAARLHTIPKVQVVYLFGSLARVGRGNDIDLVVVVSEEDSREFFRRCGTNSGGYARSEIDAYDREPKGKAKSARFLAAKGVLGLRGNSAEGHPRAPWFTEALDVHLYPPNWLQRLEALQGKLKYRDPNFVRTVASEARRFDPQLEVFEPAPVPATV